MIIEMSKVRIMGPRPRLPEVLGALQDLGVLHLAPPEAEHLSPLALTPSQERERRHLQDALADVERGLSELGLSAGPAPRVGPATTQDVAGWVRLAWKVRRSVERLKLRTTALDEERALILKYQHFFSAFRLRR